MHQRPNEEFRGVYVSWEIGIEKGKKFRRRRKDRFAESGHLILKVHFQNNNGTECHVKVHVKCEGAYLSTDGAAPEWESLEKNLADRASNSKNRKATIPVKLHLNKEEPNGDPLPTYEDIEVEVHWRRASWQVARSLGSFTHKVEVR